MTGHPPHFTRETPRREAPGIPFVEEVFPEPGERPSCGRGGHVWHPLALGLLVRERCCQCGVTRKRLYVRRPRADRTG